MKRAVPAIAAVACALAAMASAATPDAAAIARVGNARGAAPCVSCHGSDGGGRAAAGFPRLAGLDAAYLLRQLDDFANGTRANPVMASVAAALSEDERKALAHYYAGLPVPAIAPPPASSGTARGEWLATRGRWNKSVPACVACHGPRGVGVGANFPPLAGQPAAYIASQLRAWQHGGRHNDPLELMQHVAAALDEQDIEAVSQWFAAQPAAPQGKGERP